MSGELKLTTSGQYQKGSAKLTIDQLIQSIDQTTQGVLYESVTIPTSDTVISTSLIGTLGWCIIQNLDLSNFVDLGPTVSGAIAPLIRLKPGERCEFRLKPGITLRGQADTASVKIQLTVFEA